MNSHTMKCGCEIIIVRNGHFYKMYRCPMHEAAPDMLAALKAAIVFIGDDLYEAKDSFQNVIYIDETEALLKRCKQAIAAAEGKQP